MKDMTRYAEAYSEVSLDMCLILTPQKTTN
jgi:hypothetical protein